MSSTLEERKENLKVNYKLIEFEIHGDQRGTLIALENNKNIPFEIKRMYYMYETGENVVRGHHAHKNLQQVLFCINGSCKVRLDDGFSEKIITLDKKNIGLYISSNIWREMFEFSEDAILAVLASELYDENDYIRNYKEFSSYLNDINRR